MQISSNYKRIANRVGVFSALTLIAAALSSCGTYHTVTDLVTSHVPEQHSGRASIVVDHSEQAAGLDRCDLPGEETRIRRGGNLADCRGGILWI